MKFKNEMNPNQQQQNSQVEQVKEAVVEPETFLGSALSSPFLLRGRAMHGLWEQEGFLSGTAVSPESKKNLKWQKSQRQIVSTTELQYSVMEYLKKAQTETSVATI